MTGSRRIIALGAQNHEVKSWDGPVTWEGRLEFSPLRSLRKVEQIPANPEHTFVLMHAPNRPLGREGSDWRLDLVQKTQVLA